MVGQCGDGFRRIVIENDMLAFCLRRYRDGDQFRHWRGWGPVDIARQPRRNGFFPAPRMAFIDGMRGTLISEVTQSTAGSVSSIISTSSSSVRSTMILSPSR